MFCDQETYIIKLSGKELREAIEDKCERKVRKLKVRRKSGEKNIHVWEREREREKKRRDGDERFDVWVSIDNEWITERHVDRERCKNS